MDSKIDYHLKVLFRTIAIKASGRKKKKVQGRMGEITIKTMAKIDLMMTKKMIFMQETDSILLRIIAKPKNNNNNN